MSQIWKIKDLELEMDLGDAEFCKKYEDSFAELGKAEKKLPKDGKNSERIIAYCNMFDILYDGIFGEGTAQKIFGGKKNETLYNEVYDSFLECAERSANEVVSVRDRALNRGKKAKRRKAQK